MGKAFRDTRMTIWKCGSLSQAKLPSFPPSALMSSMATQCQGRAQYRWVNIAHGCHGIVGWSKSILAIPTERHICKIFCALWIFLERISGFWKKKCWLSRTLIPGNTWRFFLTPFMTLKINKELSGSRYLIQSKGD